MLRKNEREKLAARLDAATLRVSELLHEPASIPVQRVSWRRHERYRRHHGRRAHQTVLPRSRSRLLRKNSSDAVYAQGNSRQAAMF